MAQEIPITDVKGVGPKTRKLLNDAGITTAGRLMMQSKASLKKLGLGKTTVDKIVENAKTMLVERSGQTTITDPAPNEEDYRYMLGTIKSLANHVAKNDCKELIYCLECDYFHTIPLYLQGVYAKGKLRKDIQEIIEKEVADVKKIFEENIYFINITKEDPNSK
ncbi:hypothetical protein LCGC14_0195830 [marine sediment metagenome]|uniref:Uncharacterized protein n=1 Tax=marine sediment metagenome TaxID=412755 RepID=A0A0F9UKG3_9ZZZZ